MLPSSHATSIFTGSLALEDEGTVLQDYIIGQRLGEGAHGSVYVAKYIPSGESFALKILQKADLFDDIDPVFVNDLEGAAKAAAGPLPTAGTEDGASYVDPEKVAAFAAVENFERLIVQEATVMQALEHPHVVKFYKFLNSTAAYYFVMELAEGGELFDLILSQKYFNEDEARKYFQQLVSAIDFCHSNGVAHKDLKAENLLLSNDNRLLVCDFGFSTKTPPEKEDAPEDGAHAADSEAFGDQVDAAGTAFGTLHYMSPEAVIASTQNTFGLGGPPGLMQPYGSTAVPTGEPCGSSFALGFSVSESKTDPGSPLVDSRVMRRQHYGSKDDIESAQSFAAAPAWATSATPTGTTSKLADLNATQPFRPEGSPCTGASTQPLPTVHVTAVSGSPNGHPQTSLYQQQHRRDSVDHHSDYFDNDSFTRYSIGSFAGNGMRNSVSTGALDGLIDHHWSSLCEGCPALVRAPNQHLQEPRLSVVSPVTTGAHRVPGSTCSSPGRAVSPKPSKLSRINTFVRNLMVSPTFGMHHRRSRNGEQGMLKSGSGTSLSAMGEGHGATATATGSEAGRSHHFHLHRPHFGEKKKDTTTVLCACETSSTRRGSRYDGSESMRTASSLWGGGGEGKSANGSPHLHHQHHHQQPCPSHLQLSQPASSSNSHHPTIPSQFLPPAVLDGSSSPNSSDDTGVITSTVSTRPRQVIVDPFQQDLWSAGVILFFMLTGRLPFDGRDEEETQFLIQKCECSFLPEEEARISPEAQQLVLSMLARDPTDRPTLEQIIETPWFVKNINIAADFPHRPDLATELEKKGLKVARSSSFLDFGGAQHVITGDEEVALEKAFHKIDSDGYGAITRDQVRDMLTTLHGDVVSKEDVSELVSLFTGDPTSTAISFQQFRDAWVRRDLAHARFSHNSEFQLANIIGTQMDEVERQVVRQLRAAFDKVDEEHTGVIRLAELRHVFERCHIPAQDSDLVSLMRFFQDNELVVRNGSVTSSTTSPALVGRGVSSVLSWPAEGSPPSSIAAQDPSTLCISFDAFVLGIVQREMLLRHPMGRKLAAATNLAALFQSRNVTECVRHGFLVIGVQNSVLEKLTGTPERLLLLYSDEVISNTENIYSFRYLGSSALVLGATMESANPLLSSSTMMKVVSSGGPPTRSVSLSTTVPTRGLSRRGTNSAVQAHRLRSTRRQLSVALQVPGGNNTSAPIVAARLLSTSTRSNTSSLTRATPPVSASLRGPVSGHAKKKNKGASGNMLPPLPTSPSADTPAATSRKTSATLPGAAFDRTTTTTTPTSNTASPPLEHTASSVALGGLGSAQHGASSGPTSSTSEEVEEGSSSRCDSSVLDTADGSVMTSPLLSLPGSVHSPTRVHTPSQAHSGYSHSLRRPLHEQSEHHHRRHRQRPVSADHQVHLDPSPSDHATSTPVQTLDTAANTPQECGDHMADASHNCRRRCHHHPQLDSESPLSGVVPSLSTTPSKGSPPTADLDGKPSSRSGHANAHSPTSASGQVVAECTVLPVPITVPPHDFNGLPCEKDPRARQQQKPRAAPPPAASPASWSSRRVVSPLSQTAPAQLGTLLSRKSTRSICSTGEAVNEEERGNSVFTPSAESDTPLRVTSPSQPPLLSRAVVGNSSLMMCRSVPQPPLHPSLADSLLNNRASFSGFAAPQAISFPHRALAFGGSGAVSQMNGVCDVDVILAPACVGYTFVKFRRIHGKTNVFHEAVAFISSLLDVERQQAMEDTMPRGESELM